MLEAAFWLSLILTSYFGLSSLYSFLLVENIGDHSLLPIHHWKFSALLHSTAVCLLYEVVYVLYDSDSIHVRVRLHRQFILLLVLYLLKVQCSKLKAQRPNGHYKKRTKQGNNSTFICILIRTTTLAATRSHNNTRLEGAFLDCNMLLITSITSEKKRKCWSPGKRDS